MRGLIRGDEQVEAEEAASEEKNTRKTATVFGESAKLRKATTSFAMSFRPFAWNNSAPTVEIFLIVDI